MHVVSHFFLVSNEKVKSAGVKSFIFMYHKSHSDSTTLTYSVGALIVSLEESLIFRMGVTGLITSVPTCITGISLWLVTWGGPKGSVEMIKYFSDGFAWAPIRSWHCTLKWPCVKSDPVGIQINLMADDYVLGLLTKHNGAYTDSLLRTLLSLGHRWHVPIRHVFFDPDFELERHDHLQKAVYKLVWLAASPTNTACLFISNVKWEAAMMMFSEREIKIWYMPRDIWLGTRPFMTF